MKVFNISYHLKYINSTSFGTVTTMATYAEHNRQEDDWIKLAESLRSSKKFTYTDADFVEVRKDFDTANNMDILAVVSAFQPLYNRDQGHLSTVFPLSKMEFAKASTYLFRYRALGGDLEYFTAGAGAPGNCVLL